MKDFQGEFNRIKNLFERKKEMSKVRNMGKFFTRANNNMFVKEVSGILEVATAMGKGTIAEEIRAEALKVLDDPRLRKAISGKKKLN